MRPAAADGGVTRRRLRRRREVELDDSDHLVPADGAVEVVDDGLYGLVPVNQLVVVAVVGSAKSHVDQLDGYRDGSARAGRINSGHRYGVGVPRLVIQDSVCPDCDLTGGAFDFRTTLSRPQRDCKSGVVVRVRGCHRLTNIRSVRRVLLYEAFDRTIGKHWRSVGGGLRLNGVGAQDGEGKCEQA